MKQLLDKGAPIDAKTEDGDTALSLAVSSGSVGSVGFLVKAGADLDLVDKVSPPPFNCFWRSLLRVGTSLPSPKGCVVSGESTEASNT